MTMSDMIYLYMAYTIIFVGFAGYMLFLHQKQIKLTRDVELLEDLVKSYGKRKKRSKIEKKEEAQDE